MILMYRIIKYYDDLRCVKVGSQGRKVSILIFSILNTTITKFRVVIYGKLIPSVKLSNQQIVHY